MSNELEDEVRLIVCHALGISDRVESMTADAPLLGAVPEFDSMAVVTVLTELQERFQFTFDEDDISAATFATLGALATYVARKVDP